MDQLSLPNPDPASKIVNEYPLPAYNYKVTVGSTGAAFSEVSGLKMEYETVVYKDGMSYASGPQLLRGQPVMNTITLKRGVVKKRDELYKWFTQQKALDIYIDLCNEVGEALIRWTIAGALPVKMETGAFSADSNDVAIEHIELVAFNLQIKYLT